MAIAAVVVHHNQPQLAGETLLAVDSQTAALQYKILVNVGAPAATAAADWQVLNLDQQATLDRAIDAALAHLGVAQTSTDDLWLWLLHDDSTPAPDALAQLIAVQESSPSAALIGPKLVNRQQPRVIQQLGLTVTRWGRIFVPVRNELDQSQHDNLQESLAVSTAAALIDVAKYRHIGGLDAHLNPMAADVDLGIRLRLAGNRVLLAPRSRVLHDGLSLAGNRRRGWLKAGTATAIRRAQIQLRVRYAPLPLAILYVLLLPVIALGQSALLFLIKHPERIGSVWGASLWGFFSAPLQFARLRNVPKSLRQALGSLRPLLATRPQIARANRARLAPESNQISSASGSSGAQPRANFLDAGGPWVMALLAALSWAYWPTDDAVSGGGLLPLSQTWQQLFQNTGSSWQSLGGGFAAPSDPFNWVLLALGSVTFFKPTLAITWFLLLAKPLAFWGAFRAVAQTGASGWLTVLGALGYALLPALSQAQATGMLPQLVAMVLLPWLVFVLSRLFNFGDAQVRGVQTWSWIGSAGLLSAAISASAPSLTPVAAVLVLALVGYRFRKVGYLIWLPIPLLALWVPSAWFLASRGQSPLALLTDPGVSVPSQQQQFWQLLLGGHTGLAFGQYSIWATLAVLIVAFFGLLGKRFAVTMWLWVAAIVTLVAGFLVQSVGFAPGGFALQGQDQVAGSSLVFTALAGLFVLMAAVLAVHNAPKSLSVLGGWLVAAWVVTLVAQFTVSVPGLLTHTDGRQAPAIVAAQAKLDPSVRVLVLQPGSAGQIQASLIPGDGVNLDDLSVAYRQYLPKLVHNQASYLKLGKLTADLASANGTDLMPVFTLAQIYYVLIPVGAQSSELGASLDSVPELEPVGQTAFGQLWRVTGERVIDASLRVETPSKSWSVTKGVQLAAVLVFALLALPTSRRGSRRFEGIDADNHDLFATEEAN